jgi:hypothetical protein
MFLDEHDGPHLEQVVGIEKSEFDRPRLRTLAERFVKQVVARHRSGTLWIVTSRTDSERVQGERTTDETYEGWRRTWMRDYRTLFPVGRVSVIGGSARLEIRMSNGRIEKEVVTGDDPFTIVSNGRLLEINYVVVTEDRGIRGEGPVGVYKYSVMLSSSEAAPVPLSAAVMNELSRRLHSRDIHATLLLNTWFRHGNIPTVYPFQAAIVPPKSLKDARPYESWCYMVEGRVACHSSR